MRKPEYKPNKGLKFIRYGGLSPNKQTNNKAPTKKGLWAFIYPYFDWFFLSGDFSNIGGRWKKDQEGNREPIRGMMKTFYYDGPIFTLINVPNSIDYDNRWYLTNTKDLYDYLPKVYAQDIKTLRKEKWKLPSDNKSPYISGMSVDHYEVFIPQTQNPVVTSKSHKKFDESINLNNLLNYLLEE